MKIKTCGLWRAQDIEYANALKPDFIGFVFAQSKREVSLQQAKVLKKNLDSQIKAVGVFVGCENARILEALREGIIDCVQIHNVPFEEMRALRDCLKCDFPHTTIIEARKAQNLEVLLTPCVADFLLLDSLHSGSGKRFDWALLEEAKKAGFKEEFFLAGGIDSQNLDEAMALKPYAIDISSGIESQGVKNFAKMQEVIARVRAWQE
ncbi:phosphoribosylanthranilate isomerase [Helicobacter himalayensis]|uniref:phosphoribosylanthranilate isomerase n=1 Tax=Helicobacter himalayensis TaxID=1591088 RepID=UPI003D6E6145